MKSFWTEIIKPIIEGLNPKIIIEIGVDKGENTLNLLEYCFENKCKLISIDPFPDSSVIELEYEYENQFTLIRDLSLNVLSDIEDVQVFFIDGDHNWYTIYNELMTIQENTKEYFPLIFLHDVEWPYARRDLYYNPDDIPSEYTNKHAKLGIDLYSKKLSEKYGINSSLDNALESDTAKNGVLTAVEDFLEKTRFDLKYFKIPGFHGLGIIYDQNTYMENYIFKRSIDELTGSLEHINDYLHKLSYTQYELQSENAKLQVKSHSNGDLKNQINDITDHNNLLKQHIKNLDDLLSTKNQEIETKNQEIETKNQEIENVKSELTRQNHKLEELELNIKTLSSSRMNDMFKNYQILFYNYLSTKPTPNKSKLAQLSNNPYLFILLKSKGNIKKAWTNIKGYRAINRLGLFNERYYLNNNKNILLSGMDPLIHYIYYGCKENKLPSDIFDGKYYLNKYKDVKTSGMNPLIHYSLYGINENKKTKYGKKISVIVTSYNHEEYIRECIDSILMQKSVEIELIVGDDCSDDNTRIILENYHDLFPEIIKLLPLTENMGVTKNIKRCLETVTGEYVAICEGDDYWTDPYKLQKQVNFLEERPDCVMCFTSILLSYTNEEKKNYVHPKNLTKDTITTRELITNNFIGNFSCCMYRTEVVKNLPDTLYDIFTVDWMFNIVCSEYGNIGFLSENMSVYRIHNEGLWSSKNSKEKVSVLIELIELYNEFFSFRYDSEFKKFQKELLSNIS